MTERIAVIIPAHNEENYLPSVLAELKQVTPEVDIVVIDDGSIDKTGHIARQAGAKVLELPGNFGYGTALQTGYLYCLRTGYDAVIQMDADGQHEPANLSKLLEERKRSGSDIVIGSRFLAAMDYKVPFFRLMGIKIFSIMARMISGHRVYDVTSGLQVIDRKVLPFLTSLYFPTDYPDADLLIMLRRSGFSISEVPVGMKPSPEGKKSMHRGPKVFYYIYKMSLSILLAMFQPKPKYKGGQT